MSVSTSKECQVHRELPTRQSAKTRPFILLTTHFVTTLFVPVTAPRRQSSTCSNGLRKGYSQRMRQPSISQAGHSKGEAMTQTLWGETKTRRRRRSRQPEPAALYSIIGSSDCEIIGHTLNHFDLAGCTTCLDCGVNIFVRSVLRSTHAIPRQSPYFVLDTKKAR